jgi:hypothetical protein
LQKKIVFTIFFLCIPYLAYSDYYQDKIMIYIDNSSENLRLSKENNRKTSNKVLNEKLLSENADQIYRWLPKARSNDKDNNIFLNRFYIVIFSNLKKPIQSIVDSFSKLSFIRSVEKISIMKTHYRPNDEFWEAQYALPQVQAMHAYGFWDIDNGEIPGFNPNNEIVVAINDLPLMWYHPDLIDNVWQNIGEDADGDGVVFEYLNDEWVLDPDDINNIDDDGDGYTDNLIGWNAHSDTNDLSVNTGLNHGTNVAGCVSSMTNNQSGIASLGWSIKLMGITLCDAGGTITSGYEGILTAAHMGADIINNSWGGSGAPEYSQALMNTVFNEYNCVVVASSGNGGINTANYPASFDRVLSVTSTSQGNVFSCWATRHETVDVAAPGDNIFTTNTIEDEGGLLYDFTTGTSFSAPIVSGALGLLKSIYPHGDRDFLISKIKLGASYFNDMDGDCNGEELNGYIGAGQLNIKDAILQSIEPELEVLNIMVLNETGIYIPGDTTELIINIQNKPGSSPVKNVTHYLSTEDPGVSLIQNQFQLGNPLPSGANYNALFLITSNDNVSHGDIEFLLEISAELDGNIPSNLQLDVDPYFFEKEINIPFGEPQQYGYPIDGVNILFSPLLIDQDNNSLPEIYFSSDSLIYGVMIGGLSVGNFPFYVNDQVITELSSGDLDNDNDNELIFGTKNGLVYGLDHLGNQLFIYEQSDSIIGFCSLSDVNNDSFFEIIFIATNDSTSKLHIIDYLGNDIEGFPIIIPEKVVAPAAVADIDMDGYSDIVFGAIDGAIYAIDISGNIKTGFPVYTLDDISSPPTLLNLDNDHELEIVLSDNNGIIYLYNHNASLINQFASGSPQLSGSISVADLNRDGLIELIFSSSDSLLHALTIASETEISNWPISLNGASISESIIIDLDNDGDLEIITPTYNGYLNVFHHDGSSYHNFPYISQDSIKSSASIGDIDNDGDYELVFGTNRNLNVLDINEIGGEQHSWKSYRGNSMRTGFYDVDLSELSLDNLKTPKEYNLGNNYPNPFNPTTRINYSLPKNSNIKLIIYDLLGNKVKTLLDDKYHSAGFSSIEWSGTNKFGAMASSGVYFYTLKAGSFYQTKKMILIK